MLKNQTVNHVSEHLSAICPVYTLGGGVKSGFIHFLFLGRVSLLNPACLVDAILLARS